MPGERSLHPDYDLLIVGAGFAGLGMAIGLLREGRRDFVVLERAGDLGGAWRDNRYPGCACDIPSVLYSFSFAPNPDWSRIYPTQGEIWGYLHRLAETRGLLPFIRFGKAVVSMVFDEAAQLWRVATADGDLLTARVVVTAAGGLSNPVVPAIEGAETFQGPMFHSARWDEAFASTGKRVALIGAGASAIQIAPALAPLAARLHLFQRTPPWVIPRHDRARKAWERRLFAAFPPVQALLRLGVYLGHEVRAVGFLGRIGILKIAQRAALAHLRRGLPDPAKRAAATPDYVLGCKRVLISNDYYPTLARDDVELVTAPIARITPKGIVTADGVERAVDAIVFATGFAVQEPLQGIEVRGAGGRWLQGDWEQGGEAYLGITVAGYPNLFLLVGPNTGLGHNSMIFMIERQVRYVLRALGLMDRRRARAMAPDPEAQDRFSRAVQARAARTVWARGGCRSWYLNAAGRNTTLWPGFTFAYAWATRRVDPQAYRFDPPASCGDPGTGGAPEGQGAAGSRTKLSTSRHTVSAWRSTKSRCQPSG